MLKGVILKMASNAVILNSLKTELLPDLKQYKDFLRMVLPNNDDDKRLINLFVDMLSEMIGDIDDAEDLSDLKDWFRLYELVNDWDSIHKNFVAKYSSDIINFKSLVSDVYTSGVGIGGVNE